MKKQVVSDELRDQLRQRSKYFVGLPVCWRGTVYRVTQRYWRRSNNTFVYDLREVVDGRRPQYQNKVREAEIQPFKREEV